MYSAKRAPVSASAAPQPSTLASRPQSLSLWHVLEASIGGGQQGKLVSRLLQKHLLARVDALPIDAIELMAGEIPQSVVRP